MNQKPESKPAYREPWFWMVMLPLFASLVMGIAMVTVAFIGADDRVYDDYYKQGRMINNRFAAENNAVEHHISADVQFDAVAGEVRLQLEGGEAPEVIELLVSHPAEAEQDQILVLRPSGFGRFSARLTEPFSGRRYLIVTAKTAEQVVWRLSSEIDFDSTSGKEISAVDHTSILP